MKNGVENTLEKNITNILRGEKKLNDYIHIWYTEKNFY